MSCSTSIGDASLSELVLRIADQASDRMSAEAAFVEIVRRYGGYFFTICDNLLSGRAALATGLSVEDLRNILLSKLWQHADKFDEPGGLSVKEQEKCFLGWCGKIANNVAMDEKMKQDCSLLADDFAIKRALADIPEISSIHRNGSVAALWFENHQMGSCTDIEIIEEAIRLGPFGALSVLRPSTQAALTQLRGLAQKHIDGDF
jgi:hypothetical protein